MFWTDGKVSLTWLILVFLCVLQRELGHYYGYVYFRQVRDKSLKRGYFQKVSEKLKLSFSRTKHKIHLHQNMCSTYSLSESKVEENV